MSSRQQLLADIEKLELQIQETLDYVRRLRERAARGERIKPVGRAMSAVSQNRIASSEDAA